MCSSCARYYIAKDFEDKTKNHKTIAVLPVEMVFTGKLPKNITQEKIDSIENEESEIFMNVLYDQLLKSTKNGKKEFRVDVLSNAQVLAILKENNVSIRDSWSKKPSDLAKTLGVDAVVQSKITKKRYLSNLASYGIDVGTQVAQEVLGGVLGIPVPGDALPYGAKKTHDVHVSCSLIDSNEGSALYSRSLYRQADWQVSLNQLITFMDFKCAKKFPYRKKR